MKHRKNIGYDTKRYKAKLFFKDHSGYLDFSEFIQHTNISMVGDKQRAVLKFNSEKQYQEFLSWLFQSPMPSDAEIKEIEAKCKHYLKN